MLHSILTLTIFSLAQALPFPQAATQNVNEGYVNGKEGVSFGMKLAIVLLSIFIGGPLIGILICQVRKHLQKRKTKKLEKERPANRDVQFGGSATTNQTALQNIVLSNITHPSPLVH